MSKEARETSPRLFMYSDHESHKWSYQSVGVAGRTCGQVAAADVAGGAVGVGPDHNSVAHPQLAGHLLGEGYVWVAPGPLDQRRVQADRSNGGSCRPPPARCRKGPDEEQVLT